MIGNSDSCWGVGIQWITDSFPLLSRDNLVRCGPVQSVALWQYGRIRKT